MVVVWVDCWTSLGGSQFVDSPGTGNYLTLPLRRGGAVGRRALPDAGRARPSRHPGQVERWLRRHGRADAPARAVGWARHPRRRRALRDVLPARTSASRSAPCGRSTVARSTGSGRTSAAGPRSRSESDGQPAQRLVHGRVLLGRPRRNGAAAVRHGDRRADPRGVGAVAAARPRAHGARARRDPPLAARDLHRRRGRGTSTSSTSARRRSVARSRGSVSPTCASSSSTPPTWTSGTATRSACAYLAERLSA